MDPRTRKAVRLRPRRRAATTAGARLAVFTSLDGTLLDAGTFQPGPSKAAVRRLIAAGVPVIPVSVMTLDEVAPIAAELGLRQAMVIEAGGAIARWSGDAWEVEACGPAAETLLDVVREIEERSGASLLIYSALPAREAARVSGRSGALLEASTHRCFTEPFIIESGALEDVQRAAAAMGFSVRRGRRFLHLCRECDEGEAFSRLREELRCDVAVAVGGTAVDAEFLSRADIAIIVPGPDGEADTDLVAAVPQARIAPTPGPEGWVVAVEKVWTSMAEADQTGAGSASSGNSTGSSSAVGRRVRATST